MSTSILNVFGPGKAVVATFPPGLSVINKEILLSIRNDVLAASERGVERMVIEVGESRTISDDVAATDAALGTETLHVAFCSVPSHMMGKLPLPMYGSELEAQAQFLQRN